MRECTKAGIGKDIRPARDKFTRVLDVRGCIESAMVVLPEEAPWALDLVSECEAFTASNTFSTRRARTAKRPVAAWRYCSDVTIA